MDFGEVARNQRAQANEARGEKAKSKSQSGRLSVKRRDELTAGGVGERGGHAAGWARVPGEQWHQAMWITELAMRSISAWRRSQLGCDGKAKNAKKQKCKSRRSDPKSMGRAKANGAWRNKCFGRMVRQDRCFLRGRWIHDRRINARTRPGKNRQTVPPDCFEV